MIGRVHDGPAGRTLRIDPAMTRASAAAFAEGGDDHDFAAAIDDGLALFAFALDQPEAFARLARRFPQLRNIVEQRGVFSNWCSTVGEGLAVRGHTFPVSCSRGHFSGMFDRPVRPGEGLSPILGGALDAFGAQRLMGASDFSVDQRRESWAELRYGV